MTTIPDHTTDITRRLYDMANHLLRQDADLCDAAAAEITRLRAALAQREPLSDAEIAALHHSAPAGVQFLQPATVRQIARAIERAHGITTSGTKGAARTEDTAPAAGERDNARLTAPDTAHRSSNE